MRSRAPALVLLALLFTAILLPAMLGSRADSAAVLPGDYNEDGTVTAADAAGLLRGISGAKAIPNRTAEAADITKNGVTDERDVLATLFMATGQIDDPVKFVERVATGLCGEALFDRFYYAGVYDDGAGNYRSANVSVSVEQRTYQKSECFIADIYVQDIGSLATAFAGGRYQGGSARVPVMAKENEAILAVNGDFYSQRNFGPIIRNGMVYNDRVNDYWDICVLTASGELIPYPYRTLTAEALAAQPVYQTWIFGPSLLDEAGKAKETFRSAVTAVNPRTVIGYYTPGHYCFITVDGRQGGYSKGLTMQELSALCEELGLAAAYNLDGGRSAVMATRTGMINHPTGGGRVVSDIVFIREPGV